MLCCILLRLGHFLGGENYHRQMDHAQTNSLAVAVSAACMSLPVPVPVLHDGA